MKKYLLPLIILLFSGTIMAQIDSIATDSLRNVDDLIPSLAVSSDVLQNEMQSQDVSGLLQASRDVFTSIAGFNLSSGRFRIRGYGSENFTVMLNGVPVNEPELRWAIWANWGGLNDITRYQFTRTGISKNPFTFGSIGGFSNVELRASKLRKGTRVSYALTNRSYRNRPMITHNTGMLKNGWAFSASVSSRFSDEGYVEGTYYSALSYFFSAEKKINERHSINLAVLGAPTVQGRAGLAIQEIYDITENNYYNPYWGYQNGEKRNARVRNNHKPYAFLTHYFTPNQKTKLQSIAYFNYGRGGQSNLNWYDAQDPRPDYYRYLPSYYTEEDPERAAQVLNAWQTDPNTRQINWDQLYFANTKNLYTVTNADGISGNDITGNRSKYILEEYRTDPLMAGLNSILSYKIRDNLNLSAGLNLMHYRSQNFKIVKDLLGGDFWVDVDQFAEQDFSDPNAAQNDLNNPNNVVYVGEKHGYDYDITLQKADAFGQLEYSSRKLDAYGALNIGYSRFWRTGNVRNGRFPATSFGDSEKPDFLNYGVKLGATYKVTGRHFISVNGTYMTRPPTVRNAFLAPRTRNDIVPNLGEEQILSGDINYNVRYSNFRARLTYFYTQINNQVWNRSFWHDELRSFVNYTMTGVDHLYTGAEVGAELTLLQQITLSGAFSWGQYLYNSRPTATITADNNSEVLAENRTVYLQNYKLGGMPQVAGSFGIKYSGRKFWFIGVNFNVFDQIWLDPNPDRRTEAATTGYVTTDPQWSEILDQTQLDGDFTLNAFAGKSFRLWKKYYLLLTVNVSNVLNNQSFITGGYEQLRYDPTDINKFPSRYAYLYGTTYFGMVRLSF